METEKKEKEREGEVRRNEEEGRSGRGERSVYS